MKLGEAVSKLGEAVRHRCACTDDGDGPHHFETQFWASFLHVHVLALILVLRLINSSNYLGVLLFVPILGYVVGM